MKRAALVIPIVALAAIAGANAAMGLALEMFEFRTWIVYVVAMLVLEAWLVGRSLDMSWVASMGLALLANAFTAFCCPAFIAPFLHYSMVGDEANPNPFWNAVALLTSFGLVSAFFESFFWIIPGIKRKNAWIWLRVFLAHLVGVPVALAILLIPSRPYVGLEAFAGGQRRQIRNQAIRNLQDDLNDGGVIRQKSLPDLITQELAGRDESWFDKSQAWTAAYAPEFHRFDTREMRRVPYELNQSLVGKGARDIKGQTWLIRSLDEDGFASGFVIEQVGYARDPEVAIEQTSRREFLFPPVQ